MWSNVRKISFRSYTSICYPQVVIVPTGLGGKLSTEDHAKLYDTCKAVEKQLKDVGVRTLADLRENYSPPWKYNHWELKGKSIVNVFS